MQNILDAYEVLKRMEAVTSEINEIDKAVALFVDAVPKGLLDDGARGYFLLKEAYVQLDAARKQVYKRVDFLNKGAIPEMLANAGEDVVLRLPDIGRSFRSQVKYSASMLDKEKGFAWLRERGDGALITETVNAGTLASYMKDLISNEGIDPPDDIFKLSSYNVTGVTKYTPK